MKMLGILLMSAALSDSGQGPVVELGATVTGNQEQPKVLYIVPWQPGDGPDTLYQDFSSQIDNLFDPVARQSFQRELQLRKHFDQLSQQSEEQ